MSACRRAICFSRPRPSSTGAGDLFLGAGPFVERGGAAEQLLQPVAQGDATPEPRLEVGVLVGDVGSGDAALFFLPQPRHFIHDAVELCRGYPRLDARIPVAAGAGALQVAPRLLDDMLHATGDDDGRVDLQLLLPGADGHAVYGRYACCDRLRRRDGVDPAAYTRGGDPGGEQRGAGAMHGRA